MLKKLIIFFAVLLMLCQYALAASPPELVSYAAILAEKSTGEVLFEQNAHERLYPASMTKIMTSIIALEYGNMDDIVTVSADATAGLPERGSAVYLIPGEEIAFSDLIRYVLIASGNDGSNAIAEHVAGSIDAFVDLMNLKAEELGCEDTHFSNTHGLHDDNHYTTASDMLKISMYAMENETFASIAAETEVTLPITNKHDQTTRKFTTNHLLSTQSNSNYRLSGTIGIKTGFTTPAGYCLSAAIEQDNLTYYTVVMKSEKGEEGELYNFIDTIELMEYATDSFSMQTMLKSTEPITQLTVGLASDESNVVTLVPAEPIAALLPNDFQTSDLTFDFTTSEGVVAPVEEGQKLGELTVTYNGKSYGTVDLIALYGVERSQTLYIIDSLTSFLSSTVFRVIIGSLAAVIAIFVVYVIVVNRKRKKTRRYGRAGGKRRK